jgi:uncharacterized protein (TIGR02145 family)
MRSTAQGGPARSIQIGNQIWMGVNLNVATYRNGDPIPQVLDGEEWVGLTTGAWCYMNNDSNNRSAYGRIYNWYAVNDPRGLAPQGWHVPNNADWNELRAFLGGFAVAGGRLKEVGTLHWATPNTGATNSTEWTGLPGGERSADGGDFNGLGFNGYWWSADSTTLNSAGSRYLSYNNTTLAAVNRSKISGFSVRCIKD